MECQRVLSLVVITLLQLCRAEIKNVQPQWYSANIINDSFQPKSISDLFSTEATFSTANPIIVSSIGNYEVQLLSTSSPPTSLPSSTSFKTSTSMFPSSTPTNELSSFSTTQSPLPQYSSNPTPFQQYTPSHNQNQQTNAPSVVFQQQTSPADFKLVETMQPLLKMITELQGPPQRNVQIQQDQSTSTQNLPQNSPTTFYQSQPTETIMPQNVQYELVPQNDQTSIGPQSSTACPPQNNPPQPPNYFLIYQQAPQSYQRYPDPRPSSARTTLREASFTSTIAPPVTSTLPSTFYSTSPTFSSSSSIPTTMGTSPLVVSTNRPPSTQFISSTFPEVTVTSLSTIGSSSKMTTGSTGSSSTRIINCVQPKSTTPLPRSNYGRPLPIDKMFPLKIRVMAPSGSITNIDFNPLVSQKIQAPPIPNKKRVAHTTTRKPKTKRTPKPRKNSYERCLQGCRKNGQPLCAAPLSQFPVDPKTVRGFPSVCHMACHNSYRKDAFEKVIDGSCSKLRTRIRPIDSDSKLKREELQKVQYFLDNSGQQPIFEFTGTYS